MLSPPAELESRERREDKMPVDAAEDEQEGLNDALSADSSEELDEDEEEARRIREGFIVDEDEDEEDNRDDEEERRRRRKRRKKHHHRRGKLSRIFSRYKSLTCAALPVSLETKMRC
jgi:transcription elongation factor SPT6